MKFESGMPEHNYTRHNPNQAADKRPVVAQEERLSPSGTSRSVSHARASRGSKVASGEFNKIMGWF